jgi:hypothetical protein
MISSMAITAAIVAHLQYDASHPTQLFPFRGCKVAVRVSDVNVINVCACTPIGSATLATGAPGGETTSLTATVYIGPSRAHIVTLPTSSMAVGLRKLCLRALARDVCGHERASSVKVVLHGNTVVLAASIPASVVFMPQGKVSTCRDLE